MEQCVQLVSITTMFVIILTRSSTKSSIPNKHFELLQKPFEVKPYQINFQICQGNLMRFTGCTKISI